MVSLFLLLPVAAAKAEDELVDLVHKKVQSHLEEIAGGVEGVLGVVVQDMDGEHRFAVNADKSFAQASAIKIPILMETLKQAHEGKLKLDDMHWVEKQYQVAGSGILGELGSRSTQMSVEDLCVLMIVLSDNTATNMLIDLVGMDHVNETMASLGCPHTRLQRRMMDTAASARGEENVSTPADAAKIMRLLYQGKFVNREVSEHALAILRKEKPGDVKSALPSGVRVAFKPGAIPGVATEWAIVELERRPYLVVVMGAYGKGDELKAAIRDVSKVAFEFFERLATATKYGAYIDPEEWKGR
jgi:beta-lactamase class A